MIGNKVDAAAALAGQGSFINEGAHRRAVLINDVVYKVETEDGLGSNDAEVFALLHMTNLPEAIRIPAWSHFGIDGQTVVAMEFISGTTVWECYCYGNACRCLPYEIIPRSVIDACAQVNIFDVGGNVIQRDGIYYLIDAEI